jgi:hypothetical protein
MRIILSPILALLIATPACAHAAGPTQLTTLPDASSIVGVWRAEADGLPFVALNITNESGNLSGAVLFYFHRCGRGSRPPQPLEFRNRSSIRSSMVRP